MNKKFFTLLAGTFLMLATVFTVSAQLYPTSTSYIDAQTLLLGQPVDKLVNGANNGYYHLRLVAIGDASSNLTGFKASVGGGGLSDSLVLYLGKQETDYNDARRGTYPLFIDTLNHARANFPRAFSTAAPKAEESAAALWCVIVNDYDQGNNVTFDFVNKQQRDIPLDVEVDGWETWGFSDLDPLKVRSSLSRGTFMGDTYLVPGYVTGWEFAPTYATALDQVRPLVSYIKTDTVAVICVADGVTTMDASSNILPLGTVFIKIASANDVKNRLIEDMAYFTLYHAQPFTISAKDFNTVFGTKKDAVEADFALRKLTFDPDVNDIALENPFTKDGLWALPITGTDQVIVDIKGDTLLSQWSFRNTAGYNGSDYEITYAPKNFLDTIGYIYLTNGSATALRYLYVQQAYYEDTPLGTRFLKFGYRGSGATGDLFPGATDPTFYTGTAAQVAANIWRDSTLYGQTVWRLVYYPSGDSIYINPYQATYLPTQYDDPLTGITNMDNGKGGKLNWIDTLVQSSDAYTFRAYPEPTGRWRNLALDPASVGLPGLPATWQGIYETGGNAFKRMVARLEYGINPRRAGSPLLGSNDYTRRLEFRWYHKLYVTLQDLYDTGPRPVTLGHGNATNQGINTRIHFNIYTPCAAGNVQRTTLASDLYLIRNKLGEYLHVPLFSATDSAIWKELEPEIHPEFLPSYQWVIEKVYPNSEYSPVRLINREFDRLEYGPIILWNKWDKPFDFQYNGGWKWNDQKVNEKVINFEDLAEKDKGETFIKLSGKSKTDPYLGYTYIDPEEAIVNAYAFKYLSGIEQRWINVPTFQYWDYPNTDTTVYVMAKNQYDKMYFQIDTVLGPIGAVQAYGYLANLTSKDDLTNDFIFKRGTQVTDLAQLRRQAYRLVYQDPYKFTCYHTLCLRNDLQGQYAVGSIGQYTEFLGKPVFHLRHFYHLDGDYDQAGVALVQKVDPMTYDYTTMGTQKDAFIAYLEEIYGFDLADIVDKQIQKSVSHGSLDLGFFVASVDDQTGKLKAVLRADAATRVSTFQLELDDDPIYRRFNTTKEAEEANDDPKVLKFYSMDNPSNVLFENTGKLQWQQTYWTDYGKKNYLGVANLDQYPEVDPTSAIYVDTAYVNRGTGWIKPQYMLVVRPKWYSHEFTEEPGCVIFGNGSGVATTPDDYDPYLRGYFLINATDSAKNEYGNIDNWDYIWDTKWERLVFTDAIHWNDTLYILSGADLSDCRIAALGDEEMYDMNLVDALAQEEDTEIIKIRLDDNLHKDVVFSMRLIERGADDFIIESESSGRIFDQEWYHFGNDVYNPKSSKYIEGLIPYQRWNSWGPMIAPCEGGWVKIQNGVPVISRSDIVFSMPQAFRMNVRRTDLAMEDAVANETVAAPVVIGNDGAVTILNAAGKKFAISNILGQTVANSVLASDNVTIAAPKGIVIVNIEGEAAVKALVK